jgi:hypothetical protein
MDITGLKTLEQKLYRDLNELSALQTKIRSELQTYADGKTLKGNELVGWLGEIYGKILYKGALVDDSNEHDFVAGDMRVSVKTRKGNKSGWKQTSAISAIDGKSCPTHLMFVHLNDDYTLDRIWLFDWDWVRLHASKHIVREQLRSIIYKVNETRDLPKVVYPCPISPSSIPPI